MAERLSLISNLSAIGAAAVWRRLLWKPLVIGVTGSVGKTTAKELIHAILFERQQGLKTSDSREARTGLPRTILKTRPWHDFLVAEVAITKPGIMWRSAALLKPDMSVVLGVNSAHGRSFESLDDTAREKAVLVRRMTRRGVAVLNGDDPRVMRAAGDGPFRVVRFGLSEGCDYRASDVRARWPQRLSFVVHHGAESEDVRTRLVGPHWTPTVLAAIAAGCEAGIPLADAVRAVGRIDPWPARLSVSRLPTGAALIVDREVTSFEALEAAVAMLRDYQGGRRILATQSMMDSPGDSKSRWKTIAPLAVTSCDLCLCYGRHAGYGRRRLLEAGFQEDAVLVLETKAQVKDYLKTETDAEDLVLLRV